MVTIVNKRMPSVVFLFYVLLFLLYTLLFTTYHQPQRERESTITTIKVFKFRFLFFFCKQNFQWFVVRPFFVYLYRFGLYSEKSIECEIFISFDSFFFNSIQTKFETNDMVPYDPYMMTKHVMRKYITMRVSFAFCQFYQLLVAGAGTSKINFNVPC